MKNTMPAKKALLWILTFMFIVICTASDDQGDDDKKEVHLWNYDKQNGPGRWGKMFPDQCGEAKVRQSPVNVDTSKVSFVEEWDKINLVYQNDNQHKMTLVNNGHTVKVNIEGMVDIIGGGLGDNYKIIQLHFHWGSQDDHGSEHRIDEKTFPLEMHMVSYDTERYTTLQEALSGFNSLAVLGTLFDVVDEDNPVFDPIINALDQIKHKDDTAQIDWIDPSSMIPDDTSLFYRYDGSLTTPPCLENVIWTVFAKQQKISKDQLNKFRELFQEGDDGEEMPLVDNYRSPQPLHSRDIYSSFEPVDSDTSATGGTDVSTIVTSSVSLVIGMLALMFL